jgi:hypothetical protein
VSWPEYSEKSGFSGDLARIGMRLLPQSHGFRVAAIAGWLHPRMVEVRSGINVQALNLKSREINRWNSSAQFG